MIKHIRNSLYVGDYKYAKEHHEEFDWLVLVAENIHSVNNCPIFPLYDGSKNNPYLFWSAVEHVAEAAVVFEKVLVFCGAGLSRSPSVVLGAMVWLGKSYEDAYKILREKHPAAMPEMYFLDLLQSRYKR